MLRLIIVVLTLVIGSLHPALAERRLAFVAGVNDYPNLSPDRQLQRAVADAETVGDALTGLGFKVTRVTKGVTQEAFLRTFGEFVRGIEAGDTAVFFYAGHGIAIDGTNYLVPSDIPALSSGDERLVRSRSLAETDLIADIRNQGARVTVMVIDACRDNPFPKAGTRALGSTRGLAVKEPAEGVFSIYSAGFGQEALDRLPGNDASLNSVFTRVFVEQLRKPGVNLIELGEAVRDEVAALAKGANHPQVPAVYNQVLGARRVFLAGLGPVDVALPPPPALDEAMWSFVETTGDARQIEDLIRRFPQSRLMPMWEARLSALNAPKQASEDVRLTRQADEQRAAAARAAGAAIRKSLGGLFDDLIWGQGATAEANRKAEEERRAVETARLAEEERRKAQLAMLPPQQQRPEASASRALSELEGHAGSARSVAFSPDGQMLASASGDGTIKLWDVAKGTEIRSLPGQKPTVGYSVAFSPTADILAAADKNAIKLWDPATGQSRRTLSGHKAQVRSVAFSPDGRQLASGSEDRTIKLWDVASGKEIRTLPGNKSGGKSMVVAAVAFSPDGRTLASASLDANLVLWDPATGRPIKTLPGDAAGYGMSIAFSPDGRTLVLGGLHETVSLWDVSTAQVLKTFSGHKGYAEIVAFSPDGRVFASGDHEGSIRLWNVATGGEIASLSPPGSSGRLPPVNALAFSPDGRTLASASFESTVRLWDASGNPAATAGGAARPRGGDK